MTMFSLFPISFAPDKWGQFSDDEIRSIASRLAGQPVHGTEAELIRFIEAATPLLSPRPVSGPAEMLKPQPCPARGKRKRASGTPSLSRLQRLLRIPRPR